MSIKPYKLRMEQSFAQNGSRVKHYSYNQISIMLTEPENYNQIPPIYDAWDDRWIRVASIACPKGNPMSEADVKEILRFLGFDMVRSITHEESRYMPRPDREFTQFYRQVIIPTSVNDPDLYDRAKALSAS